MFSGLSPDESLVEIMEFRHHPWFLACQFHPEFKSRPLMPHPLFRGFVKAVMAHRAQELKGRALNKKKKAVSALPRKNSRKQTRSNEADKD